MGSSEPVVSVGAFQSNPGGACDVADRDESCFLSATIEGFIDQGRQAISVMNQEHSEPHAFSSKIKCNSDFPLRYSHFTPCLFQKRISLKYG